MTEPKTPRAAAARSERRTVLSPGYVHITRPETGDALTYVPGQALPGWVADAIADERRVTIDEDTKTWTVADAPARKASRS